MRAKDPPDTIKYSSTNNCVRKRLILVCLMAVSTKYSGVLNIDLSVERMLNKKLSKSRGKDGKLKICKLSYFELQQVIYVL